MKKLTGSIVALVTPFHEDGSVDLPAFGSCVTWHIANGTDAILALGTTGETASTSLEEGYQNTGMRDRPRQRPRPSSSRAQARTPVRCAEAQERHLFPDGRVGAAVHQPLLCQDE